MKSWVKYVLLGIVSFMVFIIVQLPANNAYYFAENLLAEQKVPVKLFGLKGSVWNGSAKTLIYDGNRFENVTWEFHPLDLLTAKASVFLRLKNKNTALKGKLSKSISGDVILQNIQATISAAELLTLLKIPAVKLKGKFFLNLEQLVLTDKKVSFIQGRLLWSGAESQFPQKLVLGDVFADFSTQDDGVINAKLGDGGGPLELNGEIALDPDGKYDLQGFFAAREGRRSVLGRSLGFVGKYDSAGKAGFNRSGNVSEFGFLLK